MHHLSDLGPRVTGSAENEIEAVHFLMMTVRNIQKRIPDGRHMLEIDLQRVNGSFDVGFTQQYFDLQNVVVRLSSLPMTKMTRSKALLVNCHFDSQPLSPGASDDAVHCAIMLEVKKMIRLELC